MSYLGYRDLNQDFIAAIQKGRLNEFIQWMNDILQDKPAHYLAWLFATRAYEAQGDVESAANSFIHLLRLGKPGNPNAQRLLIEVRGFVLRHRRRELVKVAE